MACNAGRRLFDGLLDFRGTETFSMYDAMGSGQTTPSPPQPQALRRHQRNAGKLLAPPT